MPNNDSHQHVVKTTAQWNERAIEYWVVPRGCLCVELTPQGKTKLKVGEGNKNFYQLPYICDHGDLSNYYTKEETDALLANLNRMAIVSTNEYDSKDDLPSTGNKLGDVRFVKSSTPDTDPDIYVWNGTKWISTGSEADVSDFVTRAEFNEVKDKVDEIYPKAHTHANKDILDGITQADRDKFDSLHNYDDTEIRQLIEETGHTHPNKALLDTITPSSLWSQVDRTKFNSLHNYDDTEVKFRLATVEEKAHTHANKSVLDGITQEKLDEIDELAATYVIVKRDILDLKEKAHTHDNKDILDGTTAAYTIDQQNELYRLSRITTFLGAGPTWDGIFGYVPAPISGQETYYLRGDGTWAKVKGGGDKYKAGEGITILSGEVISDTFPFEIFPKAAQVTQYVIYGTASGVGNAVSGHYEVPIKVSAPGYSDRTQTISIADPLYDGDYIDYQRQVFAHYRTNICSRVSVDPNYNRKVAIYSDGHIGYLNPGAYGDDPGVSLPFEIIPGATYEIHPWDVSGSRLSDFRAGMYVNLYDADMNRTRTIFQEYQGNTIIVAASNEKYMRMTLQDLSPYWGPFYWGYQTIYQLYPVETPCQLNELILYPNVVNTVDVLTTNKPNEIYVEVDEPEEIDPDDPMSEYTGIIYNDGVLDITQENPNNLNELTVHFRDNVDKTITIPASELPIASDTTLGGIKVGNNLTIDPVTGVLSATGGGGGGGGVVYDAGDGIELTYEHMIDMLFDRTEFLNSVTSAQRGTITKDTVTGSFTITATGNDAYTLPDRSSLGTVYSIQVDPNTTYKLTWTSDDPTVHGNVFAFENGDIITSYLIDQATSNELTFVTSSTCQTLNFRFGVQNSGDSLTYSDISLYKITGDATINAKLGNGLRFDTNRAIEAIPYVAGAGIDIESYAPARLPVEYQEVEYIASDGVTQNYINTGIHQPMTVVLDMKYNTNATRQYMGWSESGANRYFGVDTYSKYNVEDTPGYVTGIDLDVTERRTITVSFRTGQASTMTIEGQTITNFTTEGSNVYTTNDFLLFTMDATNYFSNATIYEVTIYDTNFQPIFHGIPCYRVSDDVSGLYDLITNTFKPSIGGNLAVGPDVVPNNSYKIINTGLLSVEQDSLDPSTLTFETVDGDIDITIPNTEYTEGTGIQIGGNIIYNRNRNIPSETYRQVEYLASDGTGYILTDIMPTYQTWYQFRYRASSDNTYPTGAVFGSTAIINGDYRNSHAFFDYYNGQLKACVFQGSDSAYGLYPSAEYQVLYQHDMVVNFASGGQNLYSLYTTDYIGNGRFNNDSLLQHVGTSNNTKGSTTQPLAIFAVNTYDVTNDVRTFENRRGGRFYYLNKMEGGLDDNLTTHYLLPCYRIADGVYGVYEIKQGVFYPVNDNTGFSVGNDLVDIVPVESNVISAKIGKGLTIEQTYGNITNAGVIDVKQDQSIPNKLTVKFVDSQKDIILPNGETYEEGDGIIFTTDLQGDTVINNTGILDVTQDYTERNKLTFSTMYGDFDITIPQLTYSGGEGITINGTTVINTGILSVTQDYTERNKLTFETVYGDIDIVIPTGDTNQYVKVSTDDSFLLLHTKPADWDDRWDRYFELTYDEITTAPMDWDPTRHYKYENDNYVLGTAGDSFVSTTWYDKHYVGLDPDTPVTFDSDVYYTGELQLIEDGETYDTAFAKINEAIEHIERLEQEVEFLHEDKIGVRTTVDPERIEFYNT